MRHSSDLYKVVNAVINTLRQQEDVCYVTTGNGGSGSGVFSPNDDWDVIRRDLLSYDSCEELDDDQAQEWRDVAERVEGWQLEKNEVLCAPNGYPYLLLDDVEKVDRMVDCFSYDTHNYTLALDCMIED